MRLAVTETHAAGFPCRRGKVRDVYDLGEQLILVATDRISAFDWVLPTPIPEKGKILTALSLFWFERLGESTHLISTELNRMPTEFASHPEIFSGRTVLVHKTKVVPIECVVRGYLAGSGWKDYQATGEICGVTLPSGLQLGERLPEPIFTPATKAEVGHDENISEADARKKVRPELIEEMKRRSLQIYRRASLQTEQAGILLADTKFEFGIDAKGDLLLIDEVLTPDSSRFWPTGDYKIGGSPPSFDKQFVRDWLESVHYNKSTPPPPLPANVVQQTFEKYKEAYERLTGKLWSV